MVGCTGKNREVCAMNEKADNRQINELKVRIDRLESQKNTLIKENNAAEDRFKNIQDLYKRYLPLIIDLVMEEDRKIASVLKALSVKHKQGATVPELESLFQALHQAILVEEPDRNKGKSLLAGLFKGSSNRLIDELKQEYASIIKTLSFSLESAHLAPLSLFLDRIIKADDFKTIGQVRADLFDFLMDYIADLDEDRGKLTFFVKDIVRQILEMEKIIRVSFDQFEAVIAPGERFDLVLTGEISQAKKALGLAGDLEGLKSRVASSLATIEVALKEKIAEEQGIKELAGTNENAFETEFVKLKKELTDATEHSKTLEQKINHDPLTGANSRRAYSARIEEEMERFMRYGSIFSLLFLDVDHFKKVNDSYGHAIGDRCLQEIIKKTSSLIRKNDMLARYGGEEFVLIMPETEGINAKNVAEKIRETIEKIEFVYKNDTVTVTVSIGVTQVREDDAVPLDVLERADRAVYQAKQDGRNRVVLI
jgi:diguanylate cyclase (GGDEF)-like protein